MDEPLSTAMKDGLGMNASLESLELELVHLTDANSDVWHRTFSFLRTNKALKSLMITLDQDVMESCLSAFRIDIAVMLQENTSLESLTIRKSSGSLESLRLSEDEDKQMAALLKKNYALENLPNIDLQNRPSDVGTILRLNEAGRRYLVEDGSSISKGVEVLISVINDINCVFLHLLENPSILCDRSGVEMVSARESKAG
jgi:hypothetical protein